MNYTFKKTSTDATFEQESIFSAIIDPAIIYDTQLNVKQVNKSFFDTYGVNPIGTNIKDIISIFNCKWLDDTSYQFNEQPCVKALNGENSSAVFSIQHRGREHFINSNSSPIIHKSQITGVLTIWHTIDNFDEITSALRKSEIFHRKIDDSLPIGVIISKNDTIEYANKSSLRLIGAQHLVEIEGVSVFKFFNSKFEKLVKKRSEQLHDGKVVEELEQKLIRLDGEERDVEIMVIISSSVVNNVLHFYLRDITSEKKMNFYNNILTSIEHVIQSSRSIPEIAQQSMEMVARAFNCDSAAVTFLLDTVWEIKHVYKFGDEIKGMLIPREDEPHALLAISEKKIVFIEDAHTDPRVNNERLKGWGIRSVIVVPLFTRHDDIGVIFFNYYNKKVFNHEEIYFLIRFSTALSLALENSELFDNLQHELTLKRANEKKLIKLNNILLALSRSSQAMVHATSEKEYISLICDIITRDCNQALAWVGFSDDDNITRVGSRFSSEYMASNNVKNDRSSYLKGPSAIALKNKKAYVCNNIAVDPEFEPWRDIALEHGFNSSISLPLIHQNQAFGVLNIYSREIDYYTEDEILLLSELAKYLAHGIVSIRLDAAKRLAEVSLKESEERFRMITEKSNALICELDLKGRVLYANAQFLDIFGWDDPFSSSLLDKCLPNDKVSFYNYIYYPETVVTKTEWTLIDKNRTWRWFRCHPGIFKTTRGVKHYSLVLFDISESKKSELQLKQNARQLKDLNATKDKFFTIIAHDLKNPFTNLMGASELLASGPGFEPETVQKLGSVINESARRGYNLLQNLLDWSRAQTNTISFEPEKINLADLIRDCWDNVKGSAINKAHKVEISVSDKLEVFGDKNMLNTVIRNLIQNAIKFTHNEGQIRIISHRNKKGIVVSVEDTGVGISPENIKKLFRLDIKFSNPGTNRETGTGLGLLLCKEFIEKHGGKMWVKSKPNEGSKFSFSIPLMLPELTSV